MDEFHYYADPDRGWAWQVPLLELRQAQFLLMSATLGDTTALAEDLTRRSGRTTAQVSGGDRPVPLHHYYELTPLHETITDLLASGQAPIYVVHFTQAAALEHAQALTAVNVASRAERDLIGEAIGGFRFNAGFGKVLNRLVRHRDRRPSRRDVAEVPPPGGAARPGRPAQGHLRDGHPRSRHQRADPHRGLRGTVEVRRTPSAPVAGARVPPDRGSGRAGGLRHRRHRGRPGARARGRERAAAGQGRRRRQEATPGRAQEGPGGFRVVGQAHPRAAADALSPRR